MITFNPLPITRQQFVDACLFYINLSYHYENTNVELVGGKPTGTANCFGIFLLALRDLSISDCDPNLPWTIFRRSRGSLLVEILHENFNPVPLAREELKVGQLLLFRWKDQNHRLKNVHHVGMIVSRPENEPYGVMLHALDRQSGGLDKINLHRITPLDYGRLEQVWDLKNFVD